jgi:hypothetical protein
MDISRREFVVLTSSALALIASPRLRAQSLRVRKEIRTLSSSEIDALKAGVKAMQALPKANFRSWLYQAGVHGAPAGDSAGVPDAGTYWNQCVHSGNHFVSWHRFELLFIEEIIRLMSDDCSFTLPYWDYIKNGFLPDPLRIPGDATNPLFNGTRSAALNNGTGALSGLDLDALDETVFNTFSSVLYGNPHSAVHGQIGGNMGSVPTAARDPVFYLHHCNIDRYWECWLRAGGGRANPGSPWTEQEFPFRTVSGRRRAVVGDIGRTADVGYTYDNLPCGRIRPDLLDIIRRLRFIRVREIPPRPIPDPWPWRPLLEFDQFVIDARPVAALLPRRELTRARLAESLGATGAVAVTLHDVEMSRAAREGGFFIEVWLAPSARALRARGLTEAQRIGAFSSFDLDEHAHGDEARASRPRLVFTLGDTARRALAASQDDAALVFVRHGLVGRDGKPLPTQEREELFTIGGLRIEAAK